MLVRLGRKLFYLLLIGAVENWRNGVEAQNLRNPAKMRFKNLADVHTAWHAKRIEQYIDACTVFEERHIGFRHNAGDNTLVSMPSGHLIADRKRSSCCNINFNHFKYAAGQFIAVLEPFELAFALFLDLKN